MIISISGKAQAGKDTVGNYLTLLFQGKKFVEGVGWMQQEQYKSPPRIKKFAGKLKDSIQFKFPSLFNTESWERGEDDYRNEYLESLKMTRRELLIAEAMSLRAINKDYWVVALMNEYKTEENRKVSDSLHYHLSDWIITDMRFKNEFQAVKEKGGICVRVEREGIPKIDSISETSLDEGVEFDFIINNNASQIELIEQVEQLYESIIKTKH